MSDDLAQELRGFEGSEALANGDFSVCYRGAAEINRLRAACSEAERTAIQAAECHGREMRRADALQKRVTELESQLQEAKLKLERNRSISQYKDDGFGGYPMQYNYYKQTWE